MAIGTGETVSPEQAQEMHAFIRNLINETFGDDCEQCVYFIWRKC